MITYNGYWFLWNIIGASQGNNTLPIGTILPYVGELSKIPHGWGLCDGTNGTPDLRDRFLQGNNTAGIFIEAGLPNITGIFNSEANVGGDTGSALSAGAFYFVRSNRGHLASGIHPYNSDIYFDASRCSSIYGRSETVQPAAYTVYYIMRIM